MKTQVRDQFIAEVNVGKASGDMHVSRISNLIATSTVQIVQHSIYCAKASGGSTGITFTDASDVKTTGINNFAQSKLPDNMLLLVTEIRLLGVELAATPTAETIKGANYGSIKGLTGVQNGVIDIFSDGKIIVKDYPLSNFIVENNHNQELGTITLGSPKFVFPGAEFKAEIRTGVNTNVNLVVKLELIGCATLN